MVNIMHYNRSLMKFATISAQKLLPRVSLQDCGGSKYSIKRIIQEYENKKAKVKDIYPHSSSLQNGKGQQKESAPLLREKILKNKNQGKSNVKYGKLKRKKTHITISKNKYLEIYKQKHIHQLPNIHQKHNNQQDYCILMSKNNAGQQIYPNFSHLKVRRPVQKKSISMDDQNTSKKYSQLSVYEFLYEGQSWLPSKQAYMKVQSMRKNLSQLEELYQDNYQ